MASIVKSVLGRLHEQTSGPITNPYDGQPYPYTTVMPRADLSMFLKTEDSRFHVHFVNRSGGEARNKNELFFSKFGPHDNPQNEATPAAAAPAFVFVRDVPAVGEASSDGQVRTKRRRGPAPLLSSIEVEH